MGKVKEKKQEIEGMLLEIYSHIGCDRPDNHDDILEFVFQDVCETADPDNWHSGDVAIAFRRWMENQPRTDGGDYFKVVHTGYEPDADREEIRIHAGKNGNVVIYQDNDKLGFIVDVYGQDDCVATLTAWEEDMAGELLEESDAPENFSMAEEEDFVDEWGQTHDEVCANLGYPEENSDDLLMVDYFWYEKKKYWIPINSSMYSEREQKIADYLRLNN